MKKIKDNLIIVGKIRATIRDVKTGKIKRVYYAKNTIQLAGRAVIARRLASNETYTGKLNYGILCTGATPTEYFRKLFSSNTYDDSTAKAYVTWFFTATEVSGTFTEWRNVIDGTVSANTGQVWSKVSVNWTKTTSETLTVDCTYQILAT
jgi:hypothetical protein